MLWGCGEGIRIRALFDFLKMVEYFLEHFRILWNTLEYFGILWNTLRNTYTLILNTNTYKKNEILKVVFTPQKEIEHHFVFFE